MKKIIFTIISLFSLHTFAVAQYKVAWAKNFGGNYVDYGFSIQQTTDGGYILFGQALSNNGDFTTNINIPNYGVIKIDANGNKQWSKSFGGNHHEGGFSIQQTTDGGYILLGWSLSNDGDFLQNNGGTDYGVIKIDANGNKQWAKNFGGNGGDQGHSIQQTTDGGYILLGQSTSNNGDFTQNNGGSDYGVIKIDANGNKQWSRNFGGSSDDQGHSIQQTTDGGYILLGQSTSNNGDFTQNNGGSDYGVIKIDTNGNKQWSKNFGGSGTDYGASIQKANDGGYILLGWSYSNNGDFAQNNGSVDYGVIKIDANGNKQWAKNFGGSGGDQGHSIQQTTDGGYILLGNSSSNDGGFAQNNGGNDYGVIKIDANGTKQWSKNFGGSNNDFGYSIQKTADDGYILLGNSLSNDGDFSQNNGAVDYGVIKIIPCPPSNATLTATQSTTNPAIYTLAASGATGYTYTWNVGGSNYTGASVTATLPGLGAYPATLYVNMGDGCVDTLQELLTVQCNNGALTSATTTVSNNGNGCTNAQSMLSVLAQNGIAPISYKWNNNATSSGISISESNANTYNYQVTVTDGIGCSLQKNVSINFENPPSIFNVNAMTVNCTNPLFIPNAQANMPASFAWSNGATQGTSINLAQNTTYSITATSSNNCSSTATQTVTVDKAPPTVNAGVNVTVNCYNPSTNMSATGTAQSYTWNNGLVQNQNISPSQTATYTVIGTGNNGCTASASKTVTVDKTLPIANAGADVTVCQNNSIQIGTAAVSGNTYAWTYGNQPIAQPTIIAPNDNLENILTVTNALNGCSKKDTMLINVLRRVVIDSISSSTGQFYACGGAINMVLTCHARGTNLQYQWFKGTFAIPNATNRTLFVNSQGVYRCRVTNVCNSLPSTPKTVTSSPLLVINGQNCVGKPMTLAANGGQISSSAWEERNTYTCGSGTFSPNGGVGISYTPNSTGDYKSLVTIVNCGTFYSNIACISPPCPSNESKVKSDDEALAAYFESLYSFVATEETTGEYVEKSAMTIVPNPNNGNFEVLISLPSSGKFYIYLTDLQGKKQLLKEGVETEGDYRFSFEEKNLINGLYFLSLQATQGILTKKMILIK